ncbi:MAG: fibrobacter succinogenes major paralogous domain-containing protein, partial [Fibromonadales bacterium]|nr:fibrobacter succinogenes major paralogous domain-containing protein [Fibromonadales bacterium]
MTKRILLAARRCSIHMLPALIALALFACSGDSSDPINSDLGKSSSSSAMPTAISKAKIYGVAQKGPFQGAVVTVYELDKNLKRTKSHSGKTDSKGYYEIEIKNGKLASPYVAIEVYGYYTNEVSGNPSTELMTLKAVADVSDKDNVNINVLTHLEADKVIELAKEGKSFDEAKKEAQKEVLAALGVKENVTRNSEDMALFGGNASDNVLLTVSVSLQGNRTTGEVSSLLAELGNSGKFDVEKGLTGIDMGKVGNNIRSLEPSAKLPDIFPAATGPNTSNGSGSGSGSGSNKGSGSVSSGGGWSGGGGGGTTPAPNTPSSSSASIADTSKCGNWNYNPATNVCEGGEVKEPVCGTVKYDPTTHFCTRSESDPKVVRKCGGKGYDTRTKYCDGNEIKEKVISLCDGFINGATRQHEGKDKKQFCDPRDGTKYVYVDIGSQTWMAENLRYSAEGSKCGNYDDNSLSDANTKTCDTYGRIYDWSTAMNGVCPAGWHLPSNAEWTTLTNFVGGELTAAPKLKANSSLWISNSKGTDDYDFSALPGGQFYSGSGSIFAGVGVYGNWWSATEYNASSAYSRNISGNNDVYKATSVKTDLYSVRCVQDDHPKEFTFADIQYWIGTGENEAMLIIQWNDGKTPEALAWGYKWEEKDGPKYGIDVINDIASVDERLFYLRHNTGVWGFDIGGLGFNASGEAKIGKNEETCQSPVDGSVQTNSYDYDSWVICNGADARWYAGWTNGYWSYWTSENDASKLGYSSVGASSRVLKNKSIDAWNAAPGMKSFPLSVITPVTPNPNGSQPKPSSSSVSVEPSSSSIEPSSSSVVLSSSSSEPEPSSSSVVLSSSSSEPEPSSSSTILSSSSEVVSSSSSAVGGGGLCA